MTRSTIHTPDDGRGHRRVFVNGRERAYCCYADTQRGIAVLYRMPLRLDKHQKRALTYRVRGTIHVEQVQRE